MSHWGDVACTQAFGPVRRPRAPRPCDWRGAPGGGQRVRRHRVRGCRRVIALRANSADTARRAARSLACGSSRWVLLARDPSARCFSDLRADVVRIDRPVGDEEVFFGDPRAAVMAGGQRSIAPDRVDPNVDGLGLFVVEENMAGFTQGAEAREGPSPGPGHRPASLRRRLRDCRKRAREGGRAGVLHHLMPNSSPRDGCVRRRRGRASASDHAQLRACPECIRQADWSFEANRFARAGCRRTSASRGSSSTAPWLPTMPASFSDADAAGARFWSTELQFRVIDRFLQPHRGYAHMEEHEIAHI